LAAYVETLAPTRCNHDATNAGMRNPTSGIVDCCARAASGHAAALASSVINSRRFATLARGGFSFGCRARRPSFNTPNIVVAEAH